MRGFEHLFISAQTHIRLLRPSPETGAATLPYTSTVVPIENLTRTQHKAMSYTWGSATTKDDIRPIQIHNQALFVRRNLFEFLQTTHGKVDLHLIDAICINQLDHERAQVQHMAKIYRRSTEVIAWLGEPSDDIINSIRALASSNRSTGPSVWMTAQLSGYRYLSHHRSPSMKKEEGGGD